MPITLHALLRGLASIIGFFSGALLGAGIYNLFLLFLVDGLGQRIDTPVISVGQMIFAAVVFFGGAVLGLKLGNDLVVKYIPARCRLCGGRAYPYQGTEVGNQVAYRCQTCMGVNLAPFYEGRGS